MVKQPRDLRICRMASGQALDRHELYCLVFIRCGQIDQIVGRDSWGFCGDERANLGRWILDQLSVKNGGVSLQKSFNSA